MGKTARGCAPGPSAMAEVAESTDPEHLVAPVEVAHGNLAFQMQPYLQTRETGSSAGGDLEPGDPG